MNDTHQTAPTEFVEAAGIRSAYRGFGAKIDVPPALLQAIAASWIGGPEAGPTRSRI
jgi:hypothetical protein